jgi:hypothetical protein
MRVIAQVVSVAKVRVDITVIDWLVMLSCDAE